jgi:hypothetical protein
MCFSPKKFSFLMQMNPSNMFLDAISKGNAMLWNHSRAQLIIQTCDFTNYIHKGMHAIFISFLKH